MSAHVDRTFDSSCGDTCWRPFASRKTLGRDTWMVLLAEDDTKNGPEAQGSGRMYAVVEEDVRCGGWLYAKVMLDLMPNEQVVVTADRCCGAGDTARVSLRTERCVSRLARKRPTSPSSSLVGVCNQPYRSFLSRKRKKQISWRSCSAM